MIRKAVGTVDKGFNIIRTAHVELGVRDLGRSRDFYVNKLGLIETESDDEHIYLRGLEEYLHHSLVLKQSAIPGVTHIAYRVSDPKDLDALAELFREQQLDVFWVESGEERAQGRALRVHDPFGMPIEFFYEMEKVPRMLQSYDKYTGARIMRIDHVNCMVPDVQKAHDWYKNQLGFRCSEYTETDGAAPQMWASWLFRKPNVHDLALMTARGPRLHHVGFWVCDTLSILHTCDLLASTGAADAIERGPGRHGLSNAFFLYLRDPDGHRIELYTGDYLTTDPDWEPIRWNINDPLRQTFWGEPAPDSWFQEATPLLSLKSGEEVKQTDPVLPQQRSQFQT